MRASTHLSSLHAGKSYSMMGYGADRGIIPLLCEALFERMQSKEASEDGLSFTVEVSYTEIYQESECHSLL